ncbi:MAG: hypothetical protein RKH07_12625 [Gammaproteobacteria bacterium]
MDTMTAIAVLSGSPVSDACRRYMTCTRAGRVSKDEIRAIAELCPGIFRGSMSTVMSGAPLSLAEFDDHIDFEFAKHLLEKSWEIDYVSACFESVGWALANAGKSLMKFGKRP